MRRPEDEGEMPAAYAKVREMQTETSGRSWETAGGHIGGTGRWLPVGVQESKDSGVTAELPDCGNGKSGKPYAENESSGGRADWGEEIRCDRSWARGARGLSVGLSITGGEQLSLGLVTFTSLADMLVLRKDQHAAAPSTGWRGSRTELRFLKKVLGDGYTRPTANTITGIYDPDGK